MPHSRSMRSATRRRWPGALRRGSLKMSSCEPCYSWNVFHSHVAGDRVKFLEGMFSLFAGGMSRQTFTGCESRGGHSGDMFVGPLATHLARLAMLDDRIAPGELHVLRLMPHAWLRADHESRFEQMPTEFGPVSVRVRLAAHNRTLEVGLETRFRTVPSRVFLHIPPVKELSQVVLNGKSLRWNPETGEVLLDQA
jgi:hypothetical protein